MNGKSGLVQSLDKIPAVLSDMIVLAEKLFSLDRGCDVLIFVSYFPIGFDGDLDKGPSSGFQDPKEFLEGFLIIGDVFEHMVAQDSIKRVFRKLDIGDIHFHHCQRGLKIGAEIIEFRQGFKN